jgi:hypothetical protein
MFKFMLMKLHFESVILCVILEESDLMWTFYRNSKTFSIWFLKPSGVLCI